MPLGWINKSEIEWTESDDGRFETGPDGRVTALLVKTEDLDQEVRYVRREPAISK